MDDLCKSTINFTSGYKRQNSYSSINEVKEVIGQMYEYLGVVLDYSTPGVVKVDTRSHTGSVMSLGKGEIQSLSCK